MRVVFNVGKALILLFSVWLIVIVWFSAPLLRNGDGEESLAKRLHEAQTEVLALKKERDALKRILRDRESAEGKVLDETEKLILEPEKTCGCVPSAEYEEYRRRAWRDSMELWNYVRAELDKFAKDPNRLAQKVNEVQEELRNHASALLVDLEEMRKHDGYEEWRKEEAKDLSALVQARLHHLQNPENCDTAKKLLCNLNKGCGYGCQIHHAVYCFITAYGTQRTMILSSQGWRYNKKGFQDVFLPLSKSCTAASGSRSSWPGDSDTDVVELPIVDSVNPRPPFLPPAIPADLAPRLSRLHGNPVVWWLGQFLLYMLRPQSHLQEMLDKTVSGMKFESPVVGIHVRRTDKVGTEAAFHSVEEYMKYVEEWYAKYELNHEKGPRRVFVASDDPKVLGECVRKYPNYQFLGDPEVARTAAVSSRYTDSSLRGVIQDIHLLSRSNYLVCTFSSQVCRIAYEIMQQKHVDASDRFKSLDDIFYFGGQSEHQQEAIYAHKPNKHNQEEPDDEMELEKGDVIGVAGNHWNGFNKGRNHRTNKIGLYPEYKTKEKIHIVQFPEYKEVTV